MCIYTPHQENMPYNFEPLKPNFYIVKWGLQGYTLFFLFLLKNIDCGYPLEPPRQGDSNAYPQSMFEQKYEIISEFFVWIFSHFVGKIFSIFEKACFHNVNLGYT